MINSNRDRSKYIDYKNRKKKENRYPIRVLVRISEETKNKLQQVSKKENKPISRIIRETIEEKYM